MAPKRISVHTNLYILQKRLSVYRGGLCMMSLPVRGVSVQRGLCPGGSLSRETHPARYGKERAVRILLECILVI